MREPKSETWLAKTPAAWSPTSVVSVLVTLASGTRGRLPAPQAEGPRERHRPELVRRRHAQDVAAGVSARTAVVAAVPGHRDRPLGEAAREKAADDDAG